jgi:hypothetical protein
MHAKRRYERFDPVTVRAAARLIRFAQARGLSNAGLEAYLRELALLQPLAGPEAHRALERVAQRLAAFGRLGVSTPFNKQRILLAQLPEPARLTLEAPTADCR